MRIVFKLKTIELAKYYKSNYTIPTLHLFFKYKNKI